MKTAIGVALQIAYEYPKWGSEHVSDMLATYDSTGERAPCDYDELMELTSAADALRRHGKTFSEAQAELLKERCRRR